MSIGKALAQYLLSDIGFAGKAGARLYPVEAPANTKLSFGKPYVTYTGMEEDVRDLEGTTGQKTGNYAYDCTALTYQEAQDLAVIVRVAFAKPGLAGVRGPGFLINKAGSFRIEILKLGPEEDQFTGPKFQDQIAIYRVEVQLEIWYLPGPRP